ncbi:MAG: CarD family transcriptional regulator [Clostridia bacterium]|nr:CarD family transcriptional regulator [Clostridia bacterium]
MYSVGELIIYGSTGVCAVSDIRQHVLEPGRPAQLCYVLCPLYQDYVIYTPVDNTKIFTRPIISRERAEALIGMIPSMRAEAYHADGLRHLTEHYEAMLKTHDCADLIRLTMSIYAKKQFAEQQRRKFGAIDERFMKRAEELLFGELAAALDIERGEVPGYIDSRVKAEAEAAT